MGQWNDDMEYEPEVLKAIVNAGTQGTDIAGIHKECMYISKPTIIMTVRKLVADARVINMGSGNYVAASAISTTTVAIKAEVASAAPKADEEAKGTGAEDSDIDEEDDSDPGDESMNPSVQQVDEAKQVEQARGAPYATHVNYGRLHRKSDRGDCAFVLWREPSVAMSIDIVCKRTGIDRRKLGVVLNALVGLGYAKRVPYVGRGSLFQWSGQFKTPFASHVDLPSYKMQNEPEAESDYVDQHKDVAAEAEPEPTAPSTHEPTAPQGLVLPQLRHVPNTSVPQSDVGYHLLHSTIAIIDRQLAQLMEMSLELQRRRAELHSLVQSVHLGE